MAADSKMLLGNVVEKMLVLPNKTRMGDHIGNDGKRKIIIVGNIGAGKSTLWRGLKDHFEDKHLAFHPEPVDLFTNYYGVDLLDQFYKGEIPVFTLNVVAIEDYLKKENSQQGPSVYDRDLIQITLFNTLHYSTGKTSMMETIIYNNLVLAAQRVPVSAVIYVKTPVDVCMKHIQYRDRPQERDITSDYLGELEILHEIFIRHIRNRGAIPVFEASLTSLEKSLASTKDTGMEMDQCQESWETTVQKFIQAWIEENLLEIQNILH